MSSSEALKDIGDESEAVGSMAVLTIHDNEEVTLAKNRNREMAFFDEVIGHLEELLIDPSFQKMKWKFLTKYCHNFDDADENKFIYTEIFQKYTDKIESYVEMELKNRIDGFKMKKFLKLLDTYADDFQGCDVYEMMASFNDFLEFKDLMLAHKAEVQGTAPNLSCLTITSHE